MTDERAREKAREMFGSDEVEIDVDARVTHLDEPDTGVEGAAWVQAWVFVPADEKNRKEEPPLAP